MGCKFIWGEVLELDGAERTAKIKPMFTDANETVDFDFCIIASGCNFNPFHPMGESLWFGTVHAEARLQSQWKEFDERFLEGRRRHVLKENADVKALGDRAAKILVVGAGFIGVEWITELNHFFPALGLSIIDFLPQCLGPLPASAAAYCSKYMKKAGIKEFYGMKYEPKSEDFWTKIGFERGARPDKEYLCMGVKASNYFMPAETKSERGPGGGGWILMNENLGVITRDGKRWGADAKGYARVYAIGDCNYSCIEGPGAPSDWPMPPIPKISYPGEEEAVIACANLKICDKILYQNKKFDFFNDPLRLHAMHWPWGAGMFATSLGPGDACFVAGANWNKGSGWCVLWGQLSAVQKEIIEASKVDECANGIVGRYIWHFVHHTPVHLWGGGPLWGY